MISYLQSLSHQSLPFQEDVYLQSSHSYSTNNKLDLIQLLSNKEYEDEARKQQERENSKINNTEIFSPRSDISHPTEHLKNERKDQQMLYNQGDQTSIYQQQHAFMQVSQQQLQIQGQINRGPQVSGASDLYSNDQAHKNPLEAATTLTNCWTFFSSGQQTDIQHKQLNFEMNRCQCTPNSQYQVEYRSYQQNQQGLQSINQNQQFNQNKPARPQQEVWEQHKIIEGLPIYNQSVEQDERFFQAHDEDQNPLQKTNNDQHYQKLLSKEFMKQLRLNELIQVLGKTQNPNQVIIQPYQKRSNSRRIKHNNSRSSKFRGVSRNGIQWQVQLGNTLQKRYVGSTYSEKEAARIYDRNAILANGLKAKTNFPYTKHEIQQFLEETGYSSYQDYNYQCQNQQPYSNQNQIL